MQKDPPVDPYQGESPNVESQLILSYRSPLTSARPTTVRVLAIIGLAVGLLALLIHGLEIVALVNEVHGPSDEIAWRAIDLAVSLVLSVLLLGSSIGCLQLAPPARRGLQVWAWSYLGWLSVCAAGLLTWAAPSANPRFNLIGSAGLEIVLNAVFGWGGLAVMSVYPILVLVTMRKPGSIAAFDGAPC
jgi:hypothetical protein